MKSLNIGSGKTPYKFYPAGVECTNVDIRENCPDVDVVCDTRKLPREWEDQYDYILASDILEHFMRQELEVDVLPEWNKVLKKGGKLEIRTPNLRAICKNYLAGRTNMKKTSWLLYGGQNYTYNFHYVIFDADGLEKFVEQFGFAEVERIDEMGSNMVMTFVKVADFRR